MDNNDETQRNEASSQADKRLRKEAGPNPYEDPVKEFLEYLLDIGVRI